MGKILDWLQARVKLWIGDRPQEGNKQGRNVFDCLCPVCLPKNDHPNDP
jgi:hypothetical protein